MSKGDCILAIDPSLTNTGICLLYKKNEEDRMYTDCIIPKKLKGAPRLIYIRDKIADLIKKSKPSYIAIEGYAMGAKGRVFDLGEIGGVLRVLFTEMNTPFVVFPPTVVKKHTHGKGNADKDQMIQAVHKKHGILFTDHNINDAFAIAMLLREYIGGKVIDGAELFNSSEKGET